MTDEEIKKIAVEVARILREKSPAFPRQTLGDSVSIGSGGKVFQHPLVNQPANSGAAATSGAAVKKSCPGGDCRLEVNTCSSSCQSCNPLTSYTPQQVKASVDRVTFCNPSEASSSIAGLIDHTLLKANATQEEIGKLCEEARKYRFASVCVNPGYVALSARLLRGSTVKVCTVIGFPLGSTTPTVKAIEARDAIANGAEEIDMVINIGALKSGNDQLALDDIKAVREATRGKVLKVILETSYLTRDEKVRACRMAKQAQADFVKTSTGFGSGGATPEDVALMRETVGPGMGVKASGGIKNAEVAAAMIKAGANRLGTSASIAIVSGGEAAKGQY
jgi:deoxyribose-phosphate aldolase